MNEALKDRAPGEIIREKREAAGLSQTELAKRIGTNQQTIDKIEDGTTRQSGFLPAISAELGINLEQLIPALKKQPGRFIPGTDLVGREDLPVFGATEAGKGTFVVTNAPVDWIGRPAPLARVQDAYGLIVADSTMSPQFWPGNIALVHPFLPPLMAVACVFYQRAASDLLSSIRFLRKFTIDEWHVTQWNPPFGEQKELILKRVEWPTCHVIVGSFTRKI